VRSDQLELDLKALGDQLAALEAARAEQDSRLAALNKELEVERGRLASTGRAIADFEQKVNEKRSELERARAEEASQQLERILKQWRKTGTSAAKAATEFLDQLALLDEERAAAEAAAAEAAAQSKVAGVAFDGEALQTIRGLPDEMQDAWGRLCDEVRRRIDEHFEDELVEAAARSPMGHAIQELPTHLQELARQRHLELFRNSPAAS
jgi:chromosome segregation ATPase